MSDKPEIEERKKQALQAMDYVVQGLQSGMWGIVSGYIDHPVVAAKIMAGPNMARQVLEKGLAGTTAVNYAGAGAGAPKDYPQPVDNRTWLLDRRAQLEREARGEWEENELAPYSLSSKHAGDPALDNL